MPQSKRTQYMFLILHMHCVYLFIYLLVIYLTALAVNQATHVATTVELLAGISFMLIS